MTCKHLNTPRIYQQKAINAWFDTCDEHESQLMCLPTGSGKTLIFFHIIARTSGLCVVVVPLLAIMDDLCQSYIDCKEFENFTQLKVCSSAGGTTDLGEIEDFLMDDSSENKLVLVTYDSLGTFLECADITETIIDLIVYDEAHHTVEANVVDLIYPIDETAGMSKLFITATPRTDRVNGVLMYNRETDEAVLDMLDSYETEVDYMDALYDIETDCGIVSFEYLFSEAVRDGWINDFEVILERTDVPKTYYSKYDIFRYLLRAVMATKNTRVLGFTQYAKSEKEGKNFVEGMLGEKANEAAQRVFQELGGGPSGEFKRLNVLGIMGGGAPGERKRILDEFERGRDDEITILFNCNVVGEGVDTKRCNAVCFIDTRSGTISVSQNIGRCTRKLDETQPKSSVIVPVAIDPTALAGTEVDTLEGKKEHDRILREQLVGCDSFLNVISALKATDPVSWLLCLRYPKKFAPFEVKEKFRKAGYRVGKPCAGGLPEAVNCVLGAAGDEMRVGPDAEPEEIVRELERPIEVHGVDRQVEKEIYGPEFTGEPIYIHLDAEQQYRPVIKVDAKPGVVKSIKRVNNRTSKIHNNDEMMVLFELEDAESDGEFYRGLTGKLVQVDVWQTKYNLLIDWLKTHDNYPRQSIYKKKIPRDEISLGRWCNKQRHYYKNKMLTKNKINLLESLEGWIWERNLHEIWMERFDYVKKYVEDNNEYPSQSSKDKVIHFHGKWITQQKQDFLKNKLDILRRNNLETLPNWVWNKSDNDWFIKYNNYKKFVLENNREPSGYNDDNDELILYRWASTQKVLFKKKHHRMTTIRFDLLSQLPLWVWECDLDKDWDENYNIVKEFIKDNDRYPKKGEICNKWVGTQKTRYNNGCLSTDRIIKLNKLKNWYWNEFNRRWSQHYEEIRQYNSPPTKSSNKKLYQWVYDQKLDYKNNKLSKERIQKLESLSWWKWDTRKTQTATPPPPKCANKTLVIRKKKTPAVPAEPKVMTLTIRKIIKPPSPNQSGIYNGTKSTDKERCNQYFVRASPIDKTVLILDGDQLYTTNLLIEHGVSRENIYIPQYEEETFKAQLQVHPNTFHMTMAEFLRARAGLLRFGAAWFDYTGTFGGNAQHCRPILDVEFYFENKMAADGGCFALTWTNTRMAETEPYYNPSEVKNYILDCAGKNGYTLKEGWYKEYINNKVPMHFVLYKVNHNQI